MMSIREHAAAFYLQAAKGTSMESIITPEAANRMAAVFELCRKSRLRREAEAASKLAADVALAALLILPHYLGLHVLPHIFK